MFAKHLPSLGLVLSVSALLWACGGESPESNDKTMTDDALTIEAPDNAISVPAGKLPDDESQAAPQKAGPATSVAYADAEPPLSIEVEAQHDYIDESGRQVIDIMQDDTLYLIASVQDTLGRYVEGAELKLSVSGKSEIRQLNGHGPKTNAMGGVRFAVSGGSEMGEETLTVSLGELTYSAYLNVISLEGNGYQSLADIEGVLPWDQLIQAQVSWGEKVMTSTFPLEVKAQSGKTVKLAGFMMPLEMGEEQSRFALTSNPPGCFYHIPGGPAGAVEVFAEEPMPVSWDPIVIEGRFEALPESEIGVVYRLHDARLVATDD